LDINRSLFDVIIYAFHRFEAPEARGTGQIELLFIVDRGFLGEAVSAKVEDEYSYQEKNKGQEG